MNMDAPPADLTSQQCFSLFLTVNRKRPCRSAAIPAPNLMESVHLRGLWSTEPGGTTQVGSKDLTSTFNHSVPALTSFSNTVEQSCENIKSPEKTPSIMDYCHLEKDGRRISQHALLHRDDETANRLSVSKNNILMVTEQTFRPDNSHLSEYLTWNINSIYWHL